MEQFNSTSRRAFLRRFGQLGLAGVAAPWAVNLAAIGEAAAFGANDYKALVCVFLYGGNDHGNTMIRVDDPGYASYSNMRQALALERASLQGTTLSPISAQPNGRKFALAPQLAGLSQLFSEGVLAVQQNVGPLIQPTSLTEYKQRTVPLPPKLFSHNDQQSVWQSSQAEGSVKGWGGAMGDLALSSGATNATFACINASGNAVFLSGDSALAYRIGVDGTERLRDLNGLWGACSNNETCINALRTLITESRQHVLEKELNKLMNRSIDASNVVENALSTAPPSIADQIPKTSLGKQLAMVARLIAGRNTIGVRRQVFLVSLGGFDHHNDLLEKHPPLLKEVNDALVGFYKTMKNLGLGQSVTAFTASDFGRCMVANGDGSDHGWGGTHFIVGDAVKGKDLYGSTPVYAPDPDFDPATGVDIGQGRLLPTTSVDQYAATLAKWFGVPDSDLRLVVPNIGNFTPHDLGFFR
ncbi:DUF1501 domain-containing protein [Vandammella animalimorsus]|uniref:Tat pathway signal protein n=1 Tax=Vandammella animalimorsus TaxID=2029117 RepID=A0A2A2APE6_9BURK|nr:DUF1501 domain-containing protein [Vandammella animalimorsus]PAT39716.1 Tat pathway signal protein [Vandammella animalimorsus]